jgi:hypothetical protein
MIETIFAIITILIFIAFGYFRFKMYGPKKCPKCGSLSLGTPLAMKNTSSMDRVFVCLKCKHEWYIDYTKDWWKHIFKK